MKAKIFPRNLTAQAHHLVEGNPVTSRPESGTDVCTPGLEIDLRTLEERFFPGLLWDYERQDGAKLVAMDDVPGLMREECIGPGVGVYLWAMYGCVHTDDLQFFGFNGAQGRVVWRRVRDLGHGRVAILFGPEPTTSNPSDRVTAQSLLEKVMNPTEPDGSVQVVRSNDGKLQCVAMAADRLRYLNPETGVIVDAFAAGELTKGLCSPWQYDFRDCGCQYWAAGKPDIVRSQYPDVRFQNFSRNREHHEKLPDKASLKERGQAVYSSAEMVSGAWHALPTVLRDLERDEWDIAPETEETSDLFSREEAAAELCYLATVEHALLIEYLFAAYSVDITNRGTSEAAKNLQRACARSAEAIRSIAVDEMRHFLWVNQLLQILEWNPSTGRAKVLGADPNRLKKGQKGCGRRRVPINYSHTLFKACPMTLRTLQSFLDIEKNSQTTDGMYARLYVSVARQHDQFPEHGRLLPLLKLIMDEGEDHHDRLVAVQKSLRPFSEDEWLLDLRPPMDEDQNVMHEIAAGYYYLLLHTISTAFRLEAGGAILLAMIRELMAELDELVTKLASEGVRFCWPLSDEISTEPHPLPDEIDREELDQTLRALEGRRQSLVGKIDRIKTSGPYGHTLLKQVPRILSLFAETGAAIRNELVRSEGKPTGKKNCRLCEYEEPEARKC